MEIAGREILEIPADRVDRWYSGTYTFNEGRVQYYHARSKCEIVPKDRVKESWLQTQFDLHPVQAGTSSIVDGARDVIVPGVGVFPRQGYVNFGKLICAYGYKHGIRHVVLAASSDNFRFKFPDFGYYTLGNQAWPWGGCPTNNAPHKFWEAYKERPYPSFEECVDAVYNRRSLGQAWSTSFAVAPGYSPDGADLYFKGSIIGPVGRNRNEIRFIPGCQEYAELLTESLNQ